ncbi:NAD(P)-dependent oxidoreductase [Citricoccus sp.]|uniref:NAD(P)-dependent oxidoreductase n=1 Tax=Citricoccus sp. TaxID=1978372 RepID=UPI0028BE2678|nr:NAD(P)-dependent oxidoreductase [Citricoccus sp.]
MSSEHVAFVGVGAIGLPMAAQIAARGFPVVGVDPFPAARDRANEEGLPSAARFTELEQRPDLVIVMVASPEQLADLVTEAVAGDVQDQAWVVMSTVGPEAIRREGQRLEAAGARVADVPVTGGVARARTGELTLFAAAEPALLEQVRPVLECLGTVRPVGEDLGEGQAVKVVNQHLCSVHIVAAAEAMHLAHELGMDPAKALDLVGSGAGASWMLSDRGPRMLADTDVAVTSTINIFVKDSGLVAEAADGVGAQIPLLRVAQERYHRAVELGLAQRDDSRVIETYSTR